MLGFMMIKNIFFGVILMSSYMFSSALYKYEELELENGLKIVAIPMNNNPSKNNPAILFFLINTPFHYYCF